MIIPTLNDTQLVARTICDAATRICGMVTDPHRDPFTDDQLADAVRKWLLRIDTQSIAQQIGVPECEEIAVVIGNTRLIFGYRGHTHRFFTGGPNWWQITFPPRWRWRFSIIHWRPK